MRLGQYWGFGCTQESANCTVLIHAHGLYPEGNLQRGEDLEMSFSGAITCYLKHFVTALLCYRVALLPCYYRILAYSLLRAEGTH